MKSKKIITSLDGLSKDIFGRSRSTAIESHDCVACGKPATTFTDKLSADEYKISGLCQACQDEVFG